MPELDLDAIRARERTATPGPWYVLGLPWSRDGAAVLHGSNDPHVGKPVADLELSLWPEFEDTPPPNRHADTEFVAHARADIPALLAEVDRLRALVVAHHFHGQALPLGRACPVCVKRGCAHSDHDLGAIVQGDDRDA